MRESPLKDHGSKYRPRRRSQIIGNLCIVLRSWVHNRSVGLSFLLSWDGGWVLFETESLLWCERTRSRKFCEEHRSFLATFVVRFVRQKYRWNSPNCISANTVNIFDVSRNVPVVDLTVSILFEKTGCEAGHILCVWMQLRCSSSSLYSPHRCLCTLDIGSLGSKWGKWML